MAKHIISSNQSDKIRPTIIFQKDSIIKRNLSNKKFMNASLNEHGKPGALSRSRIIFFFTISFFLAVALGFHRLALLEIESLSLNGYASLDPLVHDWSKLPTLSDFEFCRSFYPFGKTRNALFFLIFLLEDSPKNRIINFLSFFLLFICVSGVRKKKKM